MTDRKKPTPRDAEREPVAWRVRYRRIGRGWTWFRLHADKAKAVQDVENLIHNYKSVSYAEAVPLYTEPPAEREPETSQFLRDNLPRDWNYRIHVRGVGGVTVRAWDYEVPETEEYVAEVTQVDPRETRDDRDLLAQIRLGLERIASRVEHDRRARKALNTEPPAEE